MRYFPLLWLIGGCYLSLNAQLVFPGDLNNDGTANHIDLLPLAVAYGQTGSPRFAPDIAWFPQEAELWDAFLPVSGVNLAFVDADGNGLIDTLDIDGIVANYDSTQTDALPPPAPYGLTDTFFVDERPIIEITFDQETAGNGTVITADINLIIPNPDIFPLSNQPLAVAFTVSYNPEFIDEDAISIVFPPEATELMFVAAAPGLVEFGRSPPSGKIQFAAAGRAPAVLNQTQFLGQFIIVVEDMILLPAESWEIEIEEHFMINQSEEVIETNALIGSVLLTDTEEIGPEDGFELFPNPSSGVISFVLPQVQTSDLIIRNLQGQIVAHYSDLQGARPAIDCSHLPAGAYWASVIQAGQIVSTTSLVLQH